METPTADKNTSNDGHGAVPDAVVGKCDYACASRGCHGTPGVCHADGNSPLSPYEARVARMCDQETAVFRQVLSHHHELGRFVAELDRNKKIYGKRTLKEFAHAIQRDPEDVWAAKAFYEMYSLEELEAAVDQRISWDVIKILVQVSDSEHRSELQAKFSVGELRRPQLEADVKRILRNRTKQ